MQRRPRHRLYRILTLIGTTVILGLLIWISPRALVDYDLEGAGTISANDRLTATNTARATILQTLAGIAIGIGAYAAWRRSRISEAELRATRDRLVAEHYAKAIDQLGNVSVDVRLGGIYALQSIAGSSEQNRNAIVSVLSAFVRRSSPWPPRVAGQYTMDAPVGKIPTLASRSPDVQEALWVLSRIAPPRDGAHIRLPATDLRKARLWEGSLEWALLGSSNLQRARLQNAKLTGADLGDADLRGANLSRAILRDASLRQADLRSADLRGADLTGADADGARFEHALADDQTRWPCGVDPRQDRRPNSGSNNTAIEDHEAGAT